MKKILVIGENCIDRFVWCDCERLSPEVEVPVLLPKKVTQNYGLAGNVTENIKNLAPDYTVEFLRPERMIEKTRYCSLSTGHNFIRVDINDQVEPLTKEKFNFELKNHGYSVEDFDSIVISSYNKGYLSPETIGWISTQHPKTFVDCKFVVGEWSRKIFLLKINTREHEFNCKNLLEGFPANYVQNLIVTKGEDGAYWITKDKIFPARKVEVSSLAGAGDSFLACLVVSYLKNDGDMERAIQDANIAASIAVSKRGVYAVKTDEVWK